LSAADVQRWLNGLSDQGLAPATVRHCRATVRAALNQAVAWDLIPTNPAAGKKVASPAVPKAAVVAMTPALAEAILGAVQGTPVEGPVTVALLTGLRQGEVLGLTWADVALATDPPTLAVRHQLQRLGGTWHLVPPKAEAARRTLPLPRRAAQALHAQRQRVREQRLRAGPLWQPLTGARADAGLADLVFPSPTGRPQDARNVTRAFQRALARAGLPRLRFHDLRHGTATLLVAAGAPLRAVADLLGHARVTLTAETYAHIAPPVRQELAHRLDALLAPR
jgi:integrase